MFGVRRSVNSMFREIRRALEFSFLNALGQHAVEDGDLIGAQKISGLLKNPLIALRDLLQKVVDVRLRTEKRQVRSAE